MRQEQTDLDFGDEKLDHAASRLNRIITNLQTSNPPHPDIKSFVSFIDSAPVTLVKYFLDILELDNMWENLFIKHSAILLGWQMKLLPKFPVFSQLIGLYRYAIASQTKDEDSKLEMLEQAVKEGSVNALISVGDIYIEKILLPKSKIDVSKLLPQVDSFAKLFMTPGHLIAADIYLAAWATSLSVGDSHLAFYHLKLAEMRVESSSEYIHNAYGQDFESALEEGEVFRGSEYKGQDISKYIQANRDVIKRETKQEVNLSPITRKASFDFKTTLPPVKNLKIKIQIKDLQGFFLQKLKADLGPAESVVSYLIDSATPLLKLSLSDTEIEKPPETDIDGPSKTKAVVI